VAHFSLDNLAYLHFPLQLNGDMQAGKRD